MKQHFMGSMMLLALSAACAIGQSFEARAEGGSVPGQSTAEQQGLRPPPNPYRNAYYGDLHVHTTNSFDAYTFGTISTPADAYRYAQGEAIWHPSGYEIQLSRPLDFYAVTDHAMFLGLLRDCLLYTSPSPRDRTRSRMPSSA